MKNTKQKILVLSDLTDQSINVVRSATNIAQVIDGDIELFHVRKATKVVEKESNLLAVRGIKDNFVLVNKELKTLSDTVSKETSTPISHSFSFGNLKNEIENHIKKTNPDIIVLGKRTSKSPKIFGDNILSFVLKNFEGSILLATNDAVLEDQNNLSLGLFNNTNVASNNPYINSIISNTENPIKAFSIRDENTKTLENQNSKSGNVVSYIFENNDQTLKNISNYMQKYKVNLLLVNRKSKTESKKEALSISEINNMAYNLKVPLLFSN